VGLKPLSRLGRTTQRPTRLRNPSVAGTGPKIYSYGGQVVRIGGPGEPPPGFVTPTTSKSEWFVYWAFCRLLGIPDGDMRRYPFFGDHEGNQGRFGYQIGSRGAGGAVVDFLYYAAAGRYIAMRVQTERYHYYVGADRQVFDAIQFANLSKKFDVVDLVEFKWISDLTGKAVIDAVRSGMRGRGEVDPIASGTVRRIR